LGNIKSLLTLADIVFVGSNASKTFYVIKHELVIIADVGFVRGFPGSFHHRAPQLDQQQVDQQGGREERGDRRRQERRRQERREGQRKVR
jgi:hypothetical protein